MWTVYTTKEGDTMDTIIAKLKIKDPATVLIHKDNAKLKKDLKAGRPLPKGTKVTVPDPKAKVYVVKTRYGTEYMGEKAYKEYMKVVNAKMDEVAFKLKQQMTGATTRHDSQRKINSDQWFVAAVLDVASRIEEPTNRKQAESALKKAQGYAKSRNHAAYDREIEALSVIIATYERDVNAWVEGLIGAGTSTIQVLEGVKTVGMVCGAVAATTVIAPVGLAAGVLTGAAVGGGTQLAYDGFDNIGRVAAGTKVRSTGENLKRAAGSALAGAAGAAVVGVIMKYAGPHIIKFATSSKFVQAQAKRVLSRAPINLNKIFFKETEAVMTKLGVTTKDAFLRAQPEILVTALTKFFLRSSAGALNKYIGTGGLIKKHIIDWIAGDEKRVSGSNPETTAKSFANDVVKSGKIDEVYDDLIKTNEKTFTKILQQELKVVALAELKKQKA
ncbi:hypothetical protein Z946_3608 [Sulfitobacter noctilucicola]|uniref:Phage tail protein X n=1 Tax=Sulfitobacter noctilucicola TaxID=1342301 RepID=A0A7W6M8Q1_9RHOB|nr:hypothetical protein [Sulfitobacter noctilucicola]KIN64716.1 hypothetical protein Z946_3608 [Sulfitobacter noctilucicola]MBB4174138.1 phage tail protein X [Sulfitobacter noctilucicola]